MISYLRKSPICLGCKKFIVDNPNDEPKANEVMSLKDCSKCKFAKYCSVQCQKKDWKGHKMHCEVLYRMAMAVKKYEKDHPGIGEHKDITAQEVEQVLEERSIFYAYKSDELRYDSPVILAKYENIDREKYLSTRLSHAKYLWYYAELNNTYFLYEKYYHYIRDIIKCCPVIIDKLIYYFVMSLINLGLDDEAFKIINVWCFDFENRATEDLVTLLKAMLDEDWDKLPKHYNKYFSTEDDIQVLKVFADCNDRWNTAEHQYQLLPFVPAILAIKIRNLIYLNEKTHEKSQSYENFVQAIKEDNGSMLLGFKVKKFNQVIQTQVDDVHDIMGLVKHWKTNDLDFLDGGICELQPHLLENVPRHFAKMDRSGIEKWIRVYGNFFKRFTEEESELSNEDRRTMPWGIVVQSFITENHFHVQDFDQA